MSQIFSFTGNLGGDPERRSYTDRNNVEQPIAVFSVAVNRRFKREGQPEADWFQVKVFGPQAQACLDHLAKGRTVHVIGTVELSRVAHKSATNEDGSPLMMTYVDVNATQVDFIGPRPEGGGAANNAQAPAQAPAQASAKAALPF